MTAGTLVLTNNSDVATGTGTTFTTDLVAGDFVVVTVGGITYTLPVKTVDSDTQVTLIRKYTGPTQANSAWNAVPRATQNQVTAELVVQSTEYLRGLNYDKANWQAVFSASGDITVLLPDGSTFSGPSWKKIADLLIAIDPVALQALAEQVSADAQQVAADRLDVDSKAQQAHADAQTASTAAGTATTANTAAQQAKTDSLAAKIAAEAARDAAQQANPDNQLKKANNLSDVANKAEARTNLELKEGAIRDVGTAAGTLAAGNDTRLGTINGKTGGTLSTGVSLDSTLSTTRVRFSTINYVDSTPTGTQVDSGFYLSNILTRKSDNQVLIYSEWASEYNAGNYARTSLHVRDAIAGTSRYFRFQNNGNGYAENGTWVNGTSDGRMKKDIQRIDNPLNKMLSIQGCTWTFKMKGMEGRKGAGVIAQGLQAVFPWSVYPVGERETEDGDIVSDVISVEAGDSGVLAGLHHEAILELMGIVKEGLTTIAGITTDEAAKTALEALAEKIPPTA